ncbi:Major Facilitator Superfamily transporter [Frankia canadensis]|uniref:Major Facilitator Superfamily transporter n=1 Tax=Frankia canadensis TaxID=1836972 RepID=A0A2I2L072_9ACTN|nr:MFS transporter [Frankia canadensis]SNQ51322.1 Major Facilitator Superfamily transporter [Frankia canadensis]SOU58612.1 Major Facilitator Superfamily transporter [Frankia canadensis]
MYLADTRAAGRVGDAPRLARRAVPATVLVLGTVSLLTDISAEMVTAVLPLYLVTEMGLSPLGFGLLDGIYNGASAAVRLVGGHLADRGSRYKTVAVLGYGLSALCKPALLVARGLPAIAAVLAVDRTGKGLRTAPRDAMISLSAAPETRGRAFGVHRAMDTAGALLGPLAAFVVLRASVDGFDAVFTVSFCVATAGVAVLLLFVPGRAARWGTDTGPHRQAAVGTPAAESMAAESMAAPDAAAAARAAGTRAVLGLLGQAELRRLTLCALVLGAATVSDSFLYLVLRADVDLPVAWFPVLPVGSAASFLLLAVPFGHLADRVGRWWVFVGGHGLLLAAYGLLLAPHPAGVLPAGALPAVVLALHGAFYAATDGVLMAAAAGSVPQRLRSSGLALVQTGQAGSRFAGSLLFGAAWTAWGERAAVAAAAGALLAAVAAAMALRPDSPAPGSPAPGSAT